MIDAPMCRLCSHRHWGQQPHVFKVPKPAKPKRLGGLCERCGVRRATESHHTTHKGMGGRKGASKRENDSRRANLCKECHMKEHGLSVAEEDSKPSQTVSHTWSGTHRWITGADGRLYPLPGSTDLSDSDKQID